MNQRQKQVETICEEPRHEYQQENHAGINLGLFTPSPTDYDTEEAILANRLIKKKRNQSATASLRSTPRAMVTNTSAPRMNDYKYY